MRYGLCRSRVWEQRFEGYNMASSYLTRGLQHSESVSVYESLTLYAVHLAGAWVTVTEKKHHRKAVRLWLMLNICSRCPNVVFRTVKKVKITHTKYLYGWCSFLDNFPIQYNRNDIICIRYISNLRKYPCSCPNPAVPTGIYLTLLDYEAFAFHTDMHLPVFFPS